MQVDILLATHQGEKYLDELLFSLIRQTHSDLKICVRDDASSDGTANILKLFQNSYPEKFEIEFGRKKLGAAGNFGRLLKSCRSDYAMLSDQDDVWLAHKVKVSLEKMQSLESVYGHKLPLLVHTDLTVVDTGLRQTAPSFWKWAQLNAEQSFNRLLVQNSITGCTCLINRPLIDLARQMPGTVVMHDHWIALLAAAFGKIAALPSSTILYRQHANNMLGAKKMALKDYLKRAWKKRLACPPERYQQAELFYQLYKNKLTCPHKRALEAFLEGRTCHVLKRKYLFLRHRLFWNGPLRNCTKFFLPHPF